MTAELLEEKLVIDRIRAYYANLTKEEARKELQEKYGQTWCDAELMDQFEVQFFDHASVQVIRKDSGARGTVAYLVEPRLYFSFVPSGCKYVTAK
jgi:hypothetical protein